MKLLNWAKEKLRSAGKFVGLGMGPIPRFNKVAENVSTPKNLTVQPQYRRGDVIKKSEFDVASAVSEARKGKVVLITTAVRKWEVARQVMERGGVRVAFVGEGIRVERAVRG